MLNAGFSQLDITPPLGVELAGYGFADRRATAAHDPLLARAVALECDESRAAVVVCDLAGVSPRWTQPARQYAAGRGIPGDRLLVQATHTHSGPATVFLRNWGEQDEGYLSWLGARLVECLGSALQNLHPVELWYGEDEETTVPHNRVWEDGLVDTKVRVIGLRPEGDGEPIWLFNFACHAVVMREGNTQISADWPWAACREVEGQLGGAAVFLQGCCGDIDPVRPTESFDIAADYGARIGQAVMRAASKSERMPAYTLRGRLHQVLLPYGHDKIERDFAAMERGEFDLDEGREAQDEKERSRRQLVGLRRTWLEEMRRRRAELGEARPCQVQELMIGQVRLLGLPGEIYTSLGMQIRVGMPDAHPTLLLGYANESVGYLFEPRDYERETYASYVTAWIYNHWPYSREVGPKFADQVVTAVRAPW